MTKKFKRHNLLKRFLAMIIILAMIVPNVVPIYYAKAAEAFKTLEPLYDILPDHEFTIKFSQLLDENTIKDGYIKIYEKTSLKPVELIIKQDPYNPKNVKVRAKNNFIKGKTYTMEVRGEIRSKKNKALKKPTKMDFTVKNIFSGLPAEAGLIIVDDKAYAIDYLLNNIKMANEIITKSYDIYYTYDINYEKIYSLFKTGAVDGNNGARKYDEITYVDAAGGKHLYRWREDRQEYQLVTPKATVDVIVRSDAKQVNLNVRNIVAVPDAKYYKIKGSNLIKNLGDSILYMALGNTEEVSILSADKSVLAKGVINVDKNNSGDIKLKLAENLAQGNTAGNINNNGIATEDSEGYIYYVNNADKEKLYKLATGGIFNRNILEDKAQYVNESGDWLYYSNYTDGGKLYKVKKDGTERQKVLDDKAAYITISGEYIYYSNHSDGGKLYKVKKDGSDVKIGSDNSRHGNILVVDYGNYNGKTDEVAYINVVGDWIYYSNYSDGHKPYVIHKDGTYRGKISDQWADCVQVQGDWLYFTSGSGVISKVKKSGEGNIIPIKATTTQFNKGYHINVDGDWIFYSNAEDGGKLYKINTDGSGNKVKLSDESVGYINVVGDFIYFTTTKGKLFRLPRESNGSDKSEEVGVVKDNNDIVEIKDVYISVDYADVNRPTEWIENKYLPDKVPAIMKDNTMQQLVVVWDKTPANVTFKDGIRTYKGSVVGYNQKINLYITIPSEMLNDTNKITVYKNGNKNDMIIVEGNLDTTGATVIPRVRMKEGDVIKVYDDANKSKLLGTGTVGRDGKAILSRIDLDSYGYSFYISITRTNKAESQLTEIRQYVPALINSEDVNDKDLFGIGLDLRDMTINNWIQAQLNPYMQNYLDKFYNLLSQEIYVLPAKTVLDMSANKPLVKDLTMNTKKWDGTQLSKDEALYLNKDSKGTLFKNGSYDVYVVANFKGLASPDIQNLYPKVEGKIANKTVATFDMFAEGIPVKPTIKYQRVQGKDPTKPNAFVTLDKPLSAGEEAWLVPVSELDRVRGWRREIGPSPFEQLLIDGKDVVKFTGSGTIMPSPLGDVGSAYPVDIDYKLFIVNAVGASVESDNRITVDNSLPNIAIDKLEANPVYFVGDPVSVRSNEKSKVYIVKANVDLDIQALEEATKALNALRVDHRGSNLSLPIYKSETLIDFAPAGWNSNALYNVIAVDEAGNISTPIPIIIRRYFNDFQTTLTDARNKASATPNPPADLLASIKKAEDLLLKPNVKQSEIDAIKKELESKLGNLSKDTSLKSLDEDNIMVDVAEGIFTANIPKKEFLSKLENRYGATIQVYDASDNVVPDTDLIMTGMKVIVTAVNGNSYTYPITVDRSRPQNNTQFMEALTSSTIKIINLQSGTYEINSSVVINRNLVIKGGNLANPKVIIKPGAKIENQGVLQISRVNFDGKDTLNNISELGDTFINNKGVLKISDGSSFRNIKFNGADDYTSLIDNTGSLTIEGAIFDNIQFSSNGQSIINSRSSAVLVVTASTFTNIKAPNDKDFSFISIDGETNEGSKLENNVFGATTSGRNVRGIKVSASGTNYNEIAITKNNFSQFIGSSTNYNAMHIPIYVDGGYVSMVSNIIAKSDAGIWIDVGNTTPKIRVGTYELGADGSNADVIGGILATNNRGVAKCYFGDIVIAQNIANGVPKIYYNSSTTKTIKDVTITDVGGSLKKLVIGDIPQTSGHKFKFRMVSTKVDPVNSINVNDYNLYDPANPPENIDTSINKFMIIIEVDSANKVTKYRQIYIP